MPNEELIQQVATAAKQLSQDSPSGEVDGEAIAERLSINTESTDLYYAFKFAEERGLIQVKGWQGGMGIPYTVKAS
jgi:hypothetical protein